MNNAKQFFTTIIIFSSLLGSILALTPVVLADNLGDAFVTKLQDVAGEKGAGYNIGGNFVSLLNLIIKLALSFVGVLFLVLCLYGGYKWMTARGNEQEVEEAKNLLVAAVIGLIVILAAYLISAFVVQVVSEQTISAS